MRSLSILFLLGLSSVVARAASIPPSPTTTAVQNNDTTTGDNSINTNSTDDSSSPDSSSASTEDGVNEWHKPTFVYLQTLNKLSRSITPGNYKLYNKATNTYATFFSQGNNLYTYGAGKGNSDLPDAQVFRIAHHPAKGYPNVFSIHHDNKGGLEKCFTAAFGHTADIYAMMDMCRVDYQKRPSGNWHLTTPGSPIVSDKQLWLLVPSSKGSKDVRIVAIAHSWDMPIRCVYPRHIAGYGAMAPYHYEGLALDVCWSNGQLSNEKTFSWTLVEA